MSWFAEMPLETLRVAVLVATRDRPAALRRCLESLAAQTRPPDEVVVLDNASAVPPDVSGLNVRLVRSDGPLGVAAARQRLLDETTCEIAVLLDDDAFLVAPDVLERIAEAFAANAQLGALALPMLDFRSSPPRWLTPFGSASAAPTGPLRAAAYFVGGAHALRLSAVHAVGGYDGSFVYGEEEMDVSYRLIGRGYRLAFAPDLHVEHRPESNTPAPFNAERLAQRIRNRIVLAWRYLPVRYLPSYLAVWLGWHLRNALRHRAPSAFARGLRDGLRDARASTRTPLHGDALAYAKEHGGRLWY